MNLALFDFDSTITNCEMLPEFVYSAVPPQRLRIGKLRLAPWIADYRFGWVSGIIAARGCHRK